MSNQQTKNQTEELAEPCLENGELQFAQVVRSSLEQKGEFQKLKASLRSSILNLVRGDNVSPRQSFCKRNDHIEMVDLVNKLIMDYFHWHGYRYSIEMFAVESGVIGTECPDRQNLKRDLDIVFDEEKVTDELPILLSYFLNAMYENQK